MCFPQFCLMEEEYEFLRNHVPEQSNRLFETSSSSVERRQLDVIKIHRTISLAPFLRDTKSSMLDKINVKPYILNPEIWEPPQISPIYLQQVSHLFNIHHQNPAALAELLLRKINSKKFNFFVYSAIPCLFGYFSSQEHINIAYSFFVKIITEAPSSIGSKILEPFFTSPCVFRFLESALTPFFDRLLHDSRHNLNNFAKYYADDFEKLFRTSAPLLPHTHIVLLRLMKSKWGIEKTANFLYDKTIASLTLLFMKTRIDDTSTKYADMVLNVLKLVDKKTLTTEICSTNSFFEVPSQYSAFGQPFLYFLVSPADIKALLLLKEDVPLSINRYLNIKIDPNPVFWAKTYPAHILPSVAITRSLVFDPFEIEKEENESYERLWRMFDNEYEDSLKLIKKHSGDKDPAFYEYALRSSIIDLNTKAQTFEKFIELKLQLDATEEWYEITSAHEQFILAPISAVEINYDKSVFFLDKFLQASELYYSRVTLQFQYCAVLNTYLPYLLKDLRKQRHEFNKLWAQMINSVAKNTESLIQGGNQSKAALFWDSVEQLRSTESCYLPIAFFSLIRGMNKTLQLIDNEEDLSVVIRVIVFSKSTRLAWLYLILNVFGMSHEEFRALCTEKEHKSWVIFQRAVLTMIMSDLKLNDLFFQLQQRLFEFQEK